MSLPSFIQPASRRVQRAADRFTAEHPVGTRVIVTFPDGTTGRARIASGAFLLGNKIVVRLRGMVASYEIGQIQKAESEVPA